MYMDWPGDWTLNAPAQPTAVADCEAHIGMNFPADLRAFYLEADGGGAWFTEKHGEPGFYLAILTLDDVAGVVDVLKAGGRTDLVPFASDGAAEFFCLDRSGGPIVMINTTGGPEDAVVCGETVAGLVLDLARGWTPFDELTD